MKNTFSGRLYLLPTPLSQESNLDEIHPETLNYIKNSNLLFAEDFRTIRRFISKLKKKHSASEPQIDKLDFRLLNKKTSVEQVYNWCLELSQGKTASVLSEAGSPGVADPGSDLVRIAHELEIEVIPVSGPSSVLLALMASGMNGQKFKFHGYLPIKEKERAYAIKQLEKESFSENQTQIFIETPYRNKQLLGSILKNSHPDTFLSIARDLNGSQQWVKTQPISKWKKGKPNLNKLPCVFLLKG